MQQRPFVTGTMICVGVVGNVVVLVVLVSPSVEFVVVSFCVDK